MARSDETNPDEEYRAYVKSLAGEAPPLSPGQRATLRALLRPGVEATNSLVAETKELSHECK